MNALVVCPGPSLPIWPALAMGPLFEADVVIGVNRAVIALGEHADWWSALDWQTIIDQMFHVARGLRIFTTSQSNDRARSRDAYEYLQPKEIMLTESIQSPHYAANGETDAKAWGRFSMTGAIVLAYHLKATQVMVVGADWKDGKEADWDGHDEERFVRTPQCFQDQAIIFGNLVEWLAKRNVQVTRVVKSD